MNGDYKLVQALMNDFICEHCRFWRPLDDIESDDIDNPRECRRFPPVLVDFKRDSDGEPSVDNQQWPMTFSQQWCGEFRPKLERAQ